MLGSVIAAITGISTLVQAGKDVYKNITGEDAGTTQEQLEENVHNLSEPQQKAWIAQMEHRILMYEAETKRLIADQGTLDPALMSLLGKEEASNIAYLRMTTRPNIVLRMSHVILFPMYVAFLDGTVIILENIITMFGGKFDAVLLVDTFIAQNSFYLNAYTWAAPTAASIVLAYFGFREAGKARGNSDNPVKRDTIGDAIDAAKSVINVFKRSK